MEKMSNVANGLMIKRATTMAKDGEHLRAIISELLR